MKELEKISQDLFDKIRGRFEDVSLGDEEANATVEPEKARFFNFDFVLNGQNYGNVTISIVDQQNLKVYYSRNITSKIPESERVQWYDFLKSIRFFAKRNLMKFDTRDISRNSLSYRDVKAFTKSDSTYDSTDVRVSESKMYGNRKLSFQEMGPVKIMVRHSSPVNDEVRGARSRHIESVFVETAEGERFKMPFTHLTGARAMARHIQNGGTVHDDIGRHITDIVREMSDLRVFVRNTRGRVFEDAETASMVESACEYYGELHERLHKIKGSRTYPEFVGSFDPSDSEGDMSGFDESALRDRFTRRLFDDRMSAALSSVYKAHMRKHKHDPEPQMVREFESWAESVTSGINETGPVFDPIAFDKLFSDELPLGVDGSNAIAAVTPIIDDEGLFDTLAKAAEEDPDGDARDEIYNWVMENRPDIAAEMEKQSGQESVAEQLRPVNGGFPFDVDHMPGAVHRSMPTNIYDHGTWKAIADRISKMFDDNVDWVSNSAMEWIEIDGTKLAFWDKAKNYGQVLHDSKLQQLLKKQSLGEVVDRYDQQADLVDDVTDDDESDDGVTEIRKLAGL